MPLVILTKCDLYHHHHQMIIVELYETVLYPGYTVVYIVFEQKIILYMKRSKSIHKQVKHTLGWRLLDYAFIEP